LPLTIPSIVIGVLPLVFSLSMSYYAGPEMMSNYFIAVNFAVLLTFVSFPIATALFPVFSKLDPKKDPKLLQTVFASSVKYTAVILVPATLMLIALATPLVNTLFPVEGIIQSLFVVGAEPKFPFAPLFLVLSVLVNLFVLVGNISLGTFQTGIGKTNQVMKQSLVSLAIGLPFAYLFVAYFASFGTSFAVIGGLIGSLLASIPGIVWGLVWSWKNYRVKADFQITGKIFLASVLAAIVTYLITIFLSLPYFLVLLVGFAVFVTIYLIAAPIFGAVNEVDIQNFKAMFAGLGIVSTVLSIPLTFMSKLCKENPEKQVLTKIQ
jgi:O-antigen/teichoic acid export membrane protein